MHLTTCLRPPHTICESRPSGSPLLQVSAIIDVKFLFLRTSLVKNYDRRQCLLDQLNRFSTSRAEAPATRRAAGRWGCGPACMRTRGRAVVEHGSGGSASLTEKTDWPGKKKIQLYFFFWLDLLLLLAFHFEFTILLSLAP